MSERNARIIKITALAVIVFAAFVFRTYDVGSRDLLGDEAAYAFRSVGYVDYLGTSFQTQPIEWFAGKDLPLWSKLSFHDHPPLGFLIQHAFFRIFGDTETVARLPGVLLGTISVLFIYAVVRRIFNGSEIAGIAAALLFAVSSASIWIFRTALLEPILLFLVVVNVYCFLRFADEALWRKKYWWLFGATSGLVLLTKYTGLFLLPLYLFYLLIFSRDVWRDSRTYAASAVAVLLLSPVILYNVMLFKTVGHFDLQIAYVLGQETPEWQGLIGKTESKFKDIFHNSLNLFGPGMIALGALGLLRSLFVFRETKNKHLVFLWLYLASVTSLLIFTGAADRFLTLYIPAFVALGALLIAWLFELKKESILRHVFIAFALVFIVFEIGFAINKNFISYEDYGVAKLDAYFREEFRGAVSATIPQTDNSHLTRVIETFAERQNRRNMPRFHIIVYNDNVALSTLQWVFYRRFFYHSTPTFFVENFNRAIAVSGDEFFKDFTFYFVQSTESTILNPFKRRKTAGEEFERQLLARGFKPDATIQTKNGSPAFVVYKFKLGTL